MMMIVAQGGPTLPRGSWGKEAKMNEVANELDDAEYIMLPRSATERLARAEEVMGRCTCNYTELVRAIAGLEQEGDEE
jgi:hypothetical protein